MALKVLLLRKKLSEKQKERASLLEKKNGYDAREAELAADIEATVTDEERSAVEEAVQAFENERSETEDQLNELDEEIRELEGEIEAEERAVEEARKNKDVPEAQKRGTAPMNIETRTNFFGMTIEQRDAFVKREDVADFCKRFREFATNTRGVTGAELGIPTVMLDLLRDNLNRYSKLITKVRLRKLSGKARQNVAGIVPEGIWVEATDALEELNFSFGQVEMDGYKVGGFVEIPNSTLEDDDNLSLMTEILDGMGQAIGKAVDRAICYGDATRKPVGFITRLAATTKPSWWGGNQGAFTNLSETHLLALDIADLTGAEFFASLTEALANADPSYSKSGEAVWIMNRKTHFKLKAKALAFDASATLVAGMNNTMPVVGGEVIELNFIPDNEIIGGFLDVYTLVERAGTKIESSKEAKFVADQTVVKGVARYDGKPVIGASFIGVSLTDSGVTTTVEFPVGTTVTA